jgi:hypothetical protein
MIDIRGMANRAIQPINANQTIILTKQTGYTTAEDGSRIPTVDSITLTASQVQPLSSSELRQLEGLNLSTESRGIYFYGESHGVLRAGQNDGDKITLADGTRWLVVQVLEQWPTWAKVTVARQL